MAPAAGLAVLPWPGRSAPSTGIWPRACVDPHHHALPGHVHVDAGDGPWRGQPQECSIQLDIAHRPDPPRSEHSPPPPPIPNTKPGRALIEQQHVLPWLLDKAGNVMRDGVEHSFRDP